MKTRHIIISILFLALIALFVGQAFGDETAVITPGYEPHEADLIGVRFRSFANTGGSEMYTGLAHFGGGPNRVEADLNWEEENNVTFTFDAEADKLIASVTNENGTTTIEYLNLSEILAKKNSAYTTADLNIMQITLANRDKNSQAIFSDVKLNEQSLDSFSGTGWNDWMVSGIDFSQGFTLTGKIQLVGAFSNSQEKSKVEIKVGYSSEIFTMTATSEPTATNTVAPTATHTPEPTATNTVAPTATNTPEPTATNTVAPTATHTPEPTATNTVAPTVTNTPEPTATNTVAPTATNTPAPTATNTVAPTATNTPEPTATNTVAPTATNTTEPTATNTPEPTATNTEAPTATNTPDPTATNTVAPTATNTPEPTATNTVMPTVTSTPEPTATNTVMPTATNTPEPTATNSVEPTATNTPSPIATGTPAPTVGSPSEPTATATAEPVATIIPGPVMTKTPQAPDIPGDSSETVSYQLFIPLIVKSSN